MLSRRPNDPLAARKSAGGSSALVQTTERRVITTLVDSEGFKELAMTNT